MRPYRSTRSLVEMRDALEFPDDACAPMGSQRVKVIVLGQWLNLR